MEKPGSFELLYEKAKEYAGISLEIYKLNAVEKSAYIVSELASKFILAFFILICFLVFNIGLALYLGEILGKPYYGFFLITGFYLLLTAIIYVFRKSWIKTPVCNAVVVAALNIDKQ